MPSSNQSDTKLCPCGSQRPFDRCCAPFISGQQNPSQPEQLMRSRYCAYTLDNIDYIMATTDPTTRAHYDAKQLQQWAASVQWLALTINKQQQQDHTGLVDFSAFYRDQQQLWRHREKSRFCFKDDRWWFVDGEVNSQQLGQNSPCPCGSKKKFKRCCGSS